MKQMKLETVVGLVVILVAIIFFGFAYNVSHSSSSFRGYVLTANFEDIDGITIGSVVKLGGIKIGEVESLHLSHDSYYVTVKLTIDESVSIPIDSRAVVSTNGLMGSKYVRITPGASDRVLMHGDKIKFTQSALNIEDLIGKLMYSLTSK